MLCTYRITLIYNTEKRKIMRKAAFSKKMLAVLLTGSMVVGSTSMLTGCGTKKNGVIKLDVYSQLANTQGMQTGWGADVLKEKFNVELNIIPDADGVYQTRAQNGNLGDIVIWGSDSKDYVDAVKNNLLLDWNADDLLTDCGPYIKKHMADALKKNSGLTKTITDGAKDTTYGIAHSVATNSKNHDAFFYTWDTRWDLYKKLGYPKIKDLDAFKNMLIKMHDICPKDDNGNPTYAVSLWSDWDDGMVMYIKSTVSAYYGYDEMGIGLYDPQTGKFHDALEENGPYLQMLKFYNDLYRAGLVDPDSMTQTYDQMSAKVKSGGVLFSIFNYSGSAGYNTDAHLKAGKYMYCMKPEEAKPIVYGMNTQGTDRLTTIGAKTDYPDLCMEIINYFATPEGFMTLKYGPKGETWDYDKDRNTYFTELGKKTHADGKTKMEKHKGSFQDGQIQAAFDTWANDADNPDSNGETYNSDNWKSNITTPEYKIQQDWVDKTGCKNLNEYMEKGGNYVVAPATSYSASAKDDELKTTWKQVTTSIKENSWNAIYANTDAEFNKFVQKMKKDTAAYGYDECLKWCENEAATRHSLEKALSN